MHLQVFVNFFFFFCKQISPGDRKKIHWKPNQYQGQTFFDCYGTVLTTHSWGWNTRSVCLSEKMTETEHMKVKDLTHRRCSDWNITVKFFLWKKVKPRRDERNAEYQLRSRGEKSRGMVLSWLPAYTNVPSATEGQVMWSVAGQQVRRIIIVQGLFISVAFQMIKLSSRPRSEDFVFTNSSPEEWLTS